jgi:WD40 repeat protein
LMCVTSVREDAEHFRDEEDHWTLLHSCDGEVYSVGPQHDGTGECICKTFQSEEICPMLAHKMPILCLAFSACGDMFATGDEEGMVILWDTLTLTPQQKTPLHPDSDPFEIGTICFSADGKWLVVGDDDANLSMWDLQQDPAATFTTEPWHFNLFEKFSPYYDASETVVAMRFDPTNSDLLAVCYFNQIILFSVGTTSSSILPEWTCNGCLFLEFSPDGTQIACCMDTEGLRTIKLIDAKTGGEQWLLEHATMLLDCSFSVSGNSLASICRGGICTLWNSSTGGLLRTIEVGGEISSVSWGCDWKQDTDRVMAFAMGFHERLGAGTQVS